MKNLNVDLDDCLAGLASTGAYETASTPPPPRVPQTYNVGLVQQLLGQFDSRFGSQPQAYVSPGRINIIGEHTDYTGGLALPAAIDKALYFAIQLNQLPEYRIYAMDVDESLVVATGDLQPREPHWSNYLLGALAQLRKLGVSVPGFDLVFGGDLPVGAGVSSSAALTCGFLYALNRRLNLNLARLDIALMAQQAEHEYGGTQCGIMDQYAVLFGQSDSAIQLDCRALTHNTVPWPSSDHVLVLCHSRVNHAPADTHYNIRRMECQQGEQALSQHLGIQSLRDATLLDLNRIQTHISDAAYLRCHYVISENTRVVLASEALQLGQWRRLGRLMTETHKGLRDEFQASCEEVDSLVNLAVTCEGVLGARMMGGGFGGCTLNLIKKAAVPAFISTIEHQYYAARNLQPGFIVAQVSDGVRRLVIA